MTFQCISDITTPSDKTGSSRRRNIQTQARTATLVTPTQDKTQLHTCIRRREGTWLEMIWERRLSMSTVNRASGFNNQLSPTYNPVLRSFPRRFKPFDMCSTAHVMIRWDGLLRRFHLSARWWEWPVLLLDDSRNLNKSSCLFSGSQDNQQAAFYYYFWILKL